ncbi:MAG TPA: hypothetical protein VJ911_07220 [Cryomorphaceae bacterium]|nr:hypothetical protein [Cryomorphaceae bacterium]
MANFTPNFLFKKNQSGDDQNNGPSSFKPKKSTVNRLLAFSKALEVKQTGTHRDISFMLN